VEDIHQYLTFRMGNEEYALCVSNVKEILVVPSITRIPRMPDYMTGVINLRGAVVPVIDLKKKLGMGDTEVAAETAIIVTEIPNGSEGAGGMLTLGVFADAVHKVITIERDSIEPPPSIGLDIATDFIAGMGHSEGGFITILDITQILSANDLLDEQGLEIAENDGKTQEP